MIRIFEIVPKGEERWVMLSVNSLLQNQELLCRELVCKG